MNSPEQIKETEEIINRYKKYKRKEDVELIYKKYKAFLYQFVNYLKFDHIADSNVNMYEFRKITHDIPLKSIFHNWDNEEIFNELFIKLIDFINNYEGETIVKYIYACFKYEVKKWILSLRNDVLYRPESVVECKEEDLIEKIQNTTSEFMELENLTNLERYILYLSCNNNIPIKEISTMLKLNKQEIINIKNEAIKKLK